MSKASNQITEYLSVGGLFNPEVMNQTQHDAVRDTLMAARDDIVRLERENNALRAKVAELEQDKARLEEEILNEIEDAARLCCHTARQNREHNGIAAGSLITDSGAISSNAANLRRLAEAKRFRIVRDFGRMVIGYWPENDPNRSNELT